MNDHIKYLGIATIAYHALQAIVIIFILPLVIGATALADNPELRFLIGGVGTAITVVILLIALPGLIGGIGLLKHKSWARILTIIANVIHILNFPLGTALGVYTLWVLRKDEAKVLLNA